MIDRDNAPDRAARFEACLTPVLGLAYGTALHMLGHREDAEDLVQEAALRAYSAFDAFQEGTNFKAWFFKIMTHLVLNRARRQRREPVTGQVDLDEGDLSLYDRTRRSGLPCRGDDPAASVLGKMEAETIVAALEALPDDYRLVASLYFMGSFSYQEIAEMAGCPIGTVRSRLSRGRKLLQKALWETAVDRGLVSARRGRG